MKDPFYPEIKAVFNDYYSVKRQLDNRSLLMSNYPKVIVMTIASYFENTITKSIDDFLVSPISTPAITIPAITSSNGFTAGGNAYKKFYSKPSPGLPSTYNAQDFYNLFGSSLKTLVMNEFNQLYITYKNLIIAEEPYITHNYNTDPQNPNYEDEYEDFLVINEVLNNLTFNNAEQHLMKIKNERNSVAHNFVDSFLTSVYDLREYYYNAMIYVKAIENVFKSQTS